MRLRAEGFNPNPDSTTPLIASNPNANEQNDSASRVLRKIDYRLIPLLFITYNLNFMDKITLSSAAVFGLREDTVVSP